MGNWKNDGLPQRTRSRTISKAPDQAIPDTVGARSVQRKLRKADEVSRRTWSSADTKTPKCATPDMEREDPRYMELRSGRGIFRFTEFTMVIGNTEQTMPETLKGISI